MTPDYASQATVDIQAHRRAPAIPAPLLAIRMPLQGRGEVGNKIVLWGVEEFKPNLALIQSAARLTGISKPIRHSSRGPPPRVDFGFGGTRAAHV